MKMNTKKKIGTPKPTNTPRVKINDYMCVSPSKMQQLLKLSVGKTTTNKVHKY